MLVEIDRSAHRLRFRLVVQAEAELPVDLGLAGGIGIAEHGGHLAERLDQAPDFCSAHSSGLLPALARMSASAQARSAWV
ncbi:hypothetical protein [Micromonospora cremea]|uniref:hypothetical protein n=1 Tax=Micromonospora cremea TaxID=709881 RepID=UPI0009412E88|nr:hypothetical protein [Micromonospora cremea]